jgi:hypothetical protein
MRWAFCSTREVSSTRFRGDAFALSQDGLECYEGVSRRHSTAYAGVSDCGRSQPLIPGCPARLAGELISARGRLLRDAEGAQLCVRPAVAAADQQQRGRESQDGKPGAGEEGVVEALNEHPGGA